MADSTFYARLQKGKRIRIPDTIRALNSIEEGDYLKITVEKIKEARH